MENFISSNIRTLDKTVKVINVYPKLRIKSLNQVQTYKKVNKGPNVVDELKSGVGDPALLLALLVHIIPCGKSP